MTKKPALSSLLNHLPDAHKLLVCRCKIHFLSEEIRLEVDTHIHGHELLEDLTLAEWSIAEAIVKSNLPDRVSIWANGALYKTFDAGSTVRVNALKLQRTIASFSEKTDS